MSGDIKALIEEIELQDIHRELQEKIIDCILSLHYRAQQSHFNYIQYKNRALEAERILDGIR